MRFVHLHTHSHYSFMRGTSGLEALCRSVLHRGMDTVALTDTNGLYGLVFFLQIAEETGLRPIIGAEVVTPEERAVLLVKNKEGYVNLCRILTRKHCEETFMLSRDLIGMNQGLVILSDTLPFLKKLKGKADLYVELTGGQLNRSLLDFSKDEGIPPVATNGVYFLDPQDFHFHALLRAIDLNTKLSRLPLEEMAPASACLTTPDEMQARFPHVPEAFENTIAIAEKCVFRGDFQPAVSPDLKELDQGKPISSLRRKATDGALKRYGNMTPAVRKRLEYELEIIEEKGFGAVFLMVEDIVRQAPRTCGRGSAAASMVSYCLGITHVDPLKHNLYFDRFLNPGRKDPPDIDVDFPWDERDDILDYVFKKYGPEKSAMVANHVGFRPRAAVREVAKVYGLADNEIKQVTDRLAHLWYWGGDSVEEVVGHHPIFQGLRLHPPWPEILAWASKLLGIPRYLSVHCGGVVVAPDTLNAYVPAEKAPKGVRIVQWEKEQTEDAGLVKIDLLGNRSLAVIRDVLEAIRINTGEVIAYEGLNPLDDADTQKIIGQGDTLGVFYIESPAMRQLQKKTQRGDFEHIVIHSSIIRPAANTFINAYVRRLRGEPYRPLHPILDRVLQETYGIMVYQEDVSKIAIEMAGFSVVDGDGLRKTLSKKRNAKKLSIYREQFVRGCRSREIDMEVIEEVWKMILSFGGYSFCKPHSASYALVSFKSAYLRAHYPAEFMAAVISNRGGYYSTFAYISEARRMGLTVLGPDINASDRPYGGKGKTIRMGFMQLKGLKEKALDTVLEERERAGPYPSFENFMSRTHLDPSDIRIFIKVGCLDTIAGKRSRAELLWQTEADRQGQPDSAQISLSLFDEETVRIPSLGHYDLKTMLLHEVEILGFPLSIHPLELYRDAWETLDILPAREMENHIGKRVNMIGWWVTNKMVYTKQEKPMAFISFEDTTGLYETIFFPNTYRKYCSRFTPVRPYLLRGLIEDDLGAVSLHVEEMQFLGKRKGRGMVTRFQKLEDRALSK
ncbi:DNA polymerase III subunit alpha [bacterium]|nr:DNA polymerase III subunit alpha [bacterium]RQV94294.1 MAG: DNA polymerase III subunit alpha [bacterium]